MRAATISAMRSLWFVAALAACGTSTAAPGKAQLLADVPAWDVAIAGKRVVVIDDGFMSVTAFDAATGKRAWHEVLEQEARGRHTLKANGASALAWFGEQAHVLDVTTGKRSVTWSAPMNGVEWSEGGCGIDIADGLCARRCQCSFQVIDCATGATRGTNYQSRYIERIAPNGKRSAGCWGGGGGLLGVAGQVALITVEDYQRAMGKSLGPHITAGLELATGRELWRTELHPIGDPAFTGHSPDGKTCWFSTNVDGLTVVDCASGAQLWTTTKPAQGARHRVEYVSGRGIVELSGVRVALRDERTGKVTWSTKLPAGTTAWTKGSQQPIYWDHEGITHAAILDPATGKTLATLAVPKDAYLHRDRGGGVLLATPTELVAYDAAGAVTGRAPLQSAGVIIGETLVAATQPNATVILTRGTLRELARLPGKPVGLHVEGPLGPNRIATWAYDGKTIGKLSLYAITP